MDTQKKPVVVAVDDSQTIIAIFEATFEDCDIEFKGYCSTSAASPYLIDNTPDLLILDIMMPEQDGLSFLNELRQMPRHKDTPVVILTSKDYHQDRVDSKALNAVDFLIKPMSPKDLREMVRKHLLLK